MSDAPNLKPCPFCGCDMINRVEQDNETAWHECRLCQAVGPVEGYDQSGEPCGWNRRADLAPAPSVTVKPLEWGSKELTDNDQYSQKATSSIGIYVATDVGWFIIGLSQWHDAHDIEAAKAAAQADYTARILSAIQVSPDSGWQPIETAPKDGTAILASGLDHGKGPSRHYSVVEWMDFGCESGWYPDEDAIPLTYLTHWMPLPAPPSEGVEP